MIGNQVLTKGNRGIFLLALFFGLVGAILIYVYLSSVDGGGGGGQITGAAQPVVVTAQDIPAGTSITADMVEVQPIPEGLVLSGAFTETTDIVGKVSLYPMASGEQVLRSDFATGLLENPALAESVPDSLRGVSVEVGEITAAGGLIRPGDRVDVVVAFQDASALTVLKNVEVLAIAQNVEPSVATSEEEGVVTQRQVVTEGEAKEDAISSTLAVSPQQAQVLLAAEEFTQGGQLRVSQEVQQRLGLADDSLTCKGSVRLIMRHKGEAGTPSLTPRGTCSSLFVIIWSGFGLE
jgi:pilus assembly protein CpaB